MHVFTILENMFVFLLEIILLLNNSLIMIVLQKK